MNSTLFRHPLLALALFGAGWFAAAPALATTGNWNLTGSGNWNVNANWTANFPNAAGETARLTNNITSNTTVTIPTGIGITVGTINIGDSTGGTFNSFTVAAGTGNLTLDVTSGNATIRKVSTASTVNDTLSTPIKLADSLDLINLNTSSALVISGALTEASAGLGIAKSGSGLVTLSGTNSYTGTTNVTAGTLNITKIAALYNSTPASWTSTNINVSGGATLQVNVGGGGEFGSANVAILAGLGGSGGFANGSFLALNSTANTTISDNLTNANTVGLIKLGSTAITLTGTNNYGGSTQVQAGTVQFANTASLYNSVLPSASNLIVSSGATAAFNVGGAGEFTASDFATLAGLGTASTGFLDGSTITIDTTNAAGGVTISSPISNVNNVALIKAGTNNLTLAAQVSFTADSQLTGGGVILANENTLVNAKLTMTTSQTTPVAFSSSVGSHDFNIGGIASTNTSHNIVLQDDASNPINLITGIGGGTYNGILSGSGGFIRAAAGTQALGGTNNYTGPTLVNAGVLRFNIAAAITGLAQKVVVNTGGTMTTAYNMDQTTLNRVDSSSTGAVGMNINGTINLDFSASGANLPNVTFGATGVRNYSGIITPFNGIYRLGGGGGTLNLSAGSFLTGTGNSLVLDPHGTAASTVILNAANTYDGGTTLNPGITVGIGNDASFGASTGSVNMNGGSIDTTTAATLNVPNALFNNGVTTKMMAQSGVTLTFTGPVTGSGTISIDAGAPDSTHTGTVSFTGSVSGYSGVFEHYAYDTVGGTGASQADTLRLGQAAVSGVQDLSGVRLLTHGVFNNASNGRSVRLGDAGTNSGVVKTILGELNGDGGNVITQMSGATKQVVEIGALNSTSNFGGGFRELVFMDLVKTGNDLLTLSGTSTYGGTTTVRSGTLILAHDSLSTRLSPRGSVDGNVADTGNLFATTGSVNGTNNTVNYTANTAAVGFTPLANGNRVMFGTVGFGPVSSTEYYVVGATATSFQVSATSGGTPLAMTTNAGMTFYPVGAAGSSNTAIELGDLGASAMHTATTNADSVNLLTSGAVTIARAINVNDVGAGSMLGGNSNNNSFYTGAVNLFKNVTIAQSATTGTRALHLTGLISSATSGTKTITFGAPSFLGTTSVETTGIHDGIGTVNVTIDGNATVLAAPSSYTGDTTLNSGIVLVGHSSAFGGGNVVLNNGTVSSYGTGNVTHTVANSILVNNNIKFSATGSSTGTNNNVTYSGVITGTGNIQVDSQTPNAAGTSAQVAFRGDLTGYSGTFEHFAYDTTGGGGAGSPTANTLRFSQSTVLAIQDLSTLKLMTHGVTNFGSNGRSVRLGDNASPETGNIVTRIGALSGDGGLIITDSGAVDQQIVEIGTLNTNTSWAGAWRENTFMNFVKVGSGVFTTTGENAYSGTTTIRSGTLVLGRDAVSTTLSNRGTVNGDGIGGLFDNNLSVDGMTNTMSYTANTSAVGFIPYADGDRVLMGWGTSPGGVSATTEYYVISATSTTFKVSATPNGAELDLGNTTPSSFRAYKIGSLGTNNTTVQLGDDGLTDMHTATLNSETVSLFTGGAFTIDRPINVNNVGGGSTIGGNTDSNSTFKGAINLLKDVTIAQVATTNSNQLHVSGGISSGGGAETVTFAKSGYLGPVTVETTGISDGSGAVSVAVEGNTTTFTAANTYSGTTNVNSGTLYLNATHTGAGQYTVAGGATLGGSGTINGPGVALASGSFITPGSPSGTFMINGLLSTTGAVATENGAGDLIVTGGLSVAGSGSLDKTGPGTMTVSGAQSNGANSTLNASGGTTILNSDAGSVGNLNLNVVTSGATTVATLNSTEHLASINASGGSKVELTTNGGLYTPGNKYAHTGSLAIDATSTVDIGNGALIVNYTGNTSPYAAVLADVMGSFNGGYWDLPGLTSSAAAADVFVGGITTLGVVDNADLAYDSISGSQFSYDAVGNVPANSVLVKFTYYGDSDLNGEVTADDLTNFFYGFDGLGPASWVYGDFDYSGEVTADDLTIWALGFDNQAGTLSAGGGPVAVPEPSSILLLVLGGLGLAWRARRGKKN